MREIEFRALIIGCGDAAGGYDLRGAEREVWTHAKAYQLTPGVTLVAAVDSDSTRARQFAKAWQIPFYGTELIPAIKETKPDLISICSPTNTHVPLIKQLCRAGVRAILCEKPIAYDLPAAEQAVELCESEGVLLAVNYQRNWDRCLSRVEKAIRQSEFGRPELIRVLYSKGLIHNGSHFVSLLNRWFGELEIDKILSARAHGRKDVNADFTATSPASSRIIFQSVPEQICVLNEMEIFFERGRLELRRGGLQVSWTKTDHDPLSPKDVSLAERPKRLSVSLARAMLEVIRNFTSAARGIAKLKSDAPAALRTLRFCAGVRTHAR
ncbi:MAG: Gfo/Idh/MocA family oxidoreductase [Verrucomicrobia bacterium]|nr:Gfo/Idh/MocA family oxidoreductase [Verrucomicrobiota bacterium]